MALLKFIGGIRLRAALVKCGITLAVALLDLTAGVILTAKKSANKSMGGPFGQWAHQYDVPPRMQSGEGGMVAQSNKYPGSISGLRPIFVLFSHLFPMWGQQTDRPGHSLLRCHAFLPFFNQETRDSFLSYWFSPFQPRCGFDAYSLGQYSLPSFPYSTQTWISLHEVGFPLIVQIKVFVCMTSRAEDSKLGRWWSGKRSTWNDVADGVIAVSYTHLTLPTTPYV